tara:strand:+ start:1013 stop:1174 length:162 start_codon:yes stop_codon:yes gene_type:complete
MLSKKNTALFNWIICETGLENYTFDKKQCIKLYNEYLKCEKKDSNYNKSQKEE